MKTEKAPRTLYVAYLLFSLGFMNGACTYQGIDPVVLEAYELRMNGRADTAYTLLTGIVSEDSSNALAKYELARTMMHYFPSGALEMDRFQLVDSVGALMELAIELDPDDTQFFPMAYVAYDYKIWFSQDSLEAAEHVNSRADLLEKMIASDPEDTNLLLTKVVTYLQNPDLEIGSESTVEDLVAEIEAVDEVQGYRARLLRDPDQGGVLDRWLEMERERPNDANLQEYLAGAYMDQGQTDEAFRCINRAIELDSEKGAMVPWMMRYLFFASQSGQEPDTDHAKLAQELVSTYLETEPPKPLRAFALGTQARVIRSAGDVARADSLWEHAVSLDPYAPIYPMNPPVELFTPLK